MPPAARVTDMHTCPMVTGVVPHVGGPILPPGHPVTLIGSLPAARVGDLVTCAGPPDTIVKGSPTVLIGNMPAARMGDNTAHGGVIVLGHPTTLIGDAGSGGGGGGGGAAGAAPPGAPALAAASTGGAAPAAGESGGPIGPTSVTPAQVSVVTVEKQNTEAAESGAPLCEVCDPKDPEGLAAGATDASADLDAKMAAAPITEEELGSNEPEFTGALDEKEELRKRAAGRPKRD